MFIEIKTHYTNLDDTIGDTLDLYSRQDREVRLYDSGNNDNEEARDEETQDFHFTSLQALETFLYYLLAQAAKVLSHSTGDDSYCDYTPSFLHQYREFLTSCQSLNLDQKELPDYMKDSDYCIRVSFPRALKLNIEFYNLVIAEHDNWFEGYYKPIDLQ